MKNIIKRNLHMKVESMILSYEDQMERKKDKKHVYEKFIQILLDFCKKIDSIEDGCNEENFRKIEKIVRELNELQGIHKRHFYKEAERAFDTSEKLRKT